MPPGGFFERPAEPLSTSLMAHAAKAKCSEQVRAAALRFLETGVSPFQWIASPKAGQTLRVDSAWPLPVPDYLVPLLRTSGPGDRAARAALRRVARHGHRRQAAGRRASLV